MYFIPENFTPSEYDQRTYSNLFMYPRNHFITSRNINKAIRALQIYPTYNTIQHFITIIEHANSCKFHPFYAESVKIQAEHCQDAPTLKTLLYAHGLCPSIDTHYGEKDISINIIYVTSGYTFIKDFLQNNQYPRYPHIEQFIKQHTLDTVQTPAQHHCIFTKYYKEDEITENAEEYVIFLTEMNTEIIDKIIYALPYLFTTFTEPKPVLENINEEFIANNTISIPEKLNKLLQIYSKPIETNATLSEEFFINNYKIFTELGWKIISYQDKELLKEQFITNLQNTYQKIITNTSAKELPQINATIEDLTARLNAMYKEKEITLKRLALLNVVKSTDIEQFFETLSFFKQINIKKITANNLTLEIKGPLVNYDQDALQIYLENSNSMHNHKIQELIHDTKLQTAVHELLTEIFIEKKYTLFVQQNFNIEIPSESYPNTSLRIKSTSSNLEQYEYLPNPHISGFVCYGQALNEINKALSQQDYTTVFGQLSFATTQFTAEDTTVFAKMLQYLLSLNKKTIMHNETQQFYTFAELIEQKIK